MDAPQERRTDASHNLPHRLTSFIGREREIAEVERLLSGARLVTLVGAPGVGKTRLAHRVASDLAGAVPDGVWLVELAALTDPGLVPQAVATTLGIREQVGRPLLSTLTERLRDREVLLVLDNFEQILPAAPLLAELLGWCPRLKILITSREVLRLSGEHVLVVPPLKLPSLGSSPPEQVLQYEAVRLFVERARAARSDFVVTADNAPAVADICRQLDGLPLAIELAAARIRLFTPQALLARLERRLPLLTGGPRDLPARQQTLRDTIAWSHELLAEAECRLFRRLAVFVGGCTLEAAEAIAGGDVGTDMLDGVASLVAKSLVRELDTADGKPRFGMLETIREYGLEQLEASGEAESVQARHAAYFLRLAEEAEPHLTGREQRLWLARLEADHDNLRAALASGPTEAGLRIAGALGRFWFFRGYVSEGRGWFNRLLGRPDADRRTVARAKALWWAAGLANLRGDYAAMGDLLEESLSICEEIGDRQGVGRALTLLSLAARYRGAYEEARDLAEEGAAVLRELGDRWGLAFAIANLSGTARDAGDYAACYRLAEESAALSREVGDDYGLAQACMNQGDVARLRGDRVRAKELYREALVHLTQPTVLDMEQSARALESVAAVIGDDRDECAKAASLLAAAGAVRERMGAQVTPSRRPVLDRDMSAVRARLGGVAFAAAWADGRAMSLEQAVELALAAPEPARPTGDQVVDRAIGDASSPLSRREREVAALVARGLTNRQVAAQLIISERTVDGHVARILSKLDVATRAQVAVWAARHGLAAPDEG